LTRRLSGGELSEALGTFGRIRIIAELARKPDQSFTKYTIQQVSGMQNKSDIKANLERLVAILGLGQGVQIPVPEILDQHGEREGPALRRVPEALGAVRTALLAPSFSSSCYHHIDVSVTARTG
jgi:hypothetical protein